MYIVECDDFIVAMGRFDKYNVDLKGLKVSTLKLEFDLDNGFLPTLMVKIFRKVQSRRM